MKTGPKPLSNQERCDLFNSVNADRKAVCNGDTFLIKHKSCGQVYAVSSLRSSTVSVVSFANARLYMSLSARFRGLGCPHCETDPESAKRSRAETNLRKYGCVNPAQSDTVKRRMRRTNLSRYGATSPLASAALRAKGYRTLEEKFGLPFGSVQNTMDVPELVQKVAESANDPEVVERRLDQTRQFYKDKFGVDWLFQTDQFKRKSKRTLIRRYGVSHSNHLSTSGWRSRVKAGLDSNGHQVSVQGYEQFVIDRCAASGHFELVTTACVSIPYTHEGKARRYYPDLEAVTLNGRRFLVEVKCLYTLKKGWKLNLSKFSAARRWCKANGFGFVVIITDNKDVMEVVNRPTRRRLRIACESLTSPR